MCFIFSKFRKKKKHRVILILTTIINNSKFSIMELTLVSNQKSSGALALLDTVTNQAVPASFSNTAASSDNTASFNASVAADGTIDVVGVAAGSGNLTVSTTVNFTDSLGVAQSESKSVSVGITVTAVQVANAVSLEISFSAPVAQ
jgi:hypothetical protein